MDRCAHSPVNLASLTVTACGGCGLVEWSSHGDPVDPAVGMAKAFGSYDLIAVLPALRAPAPEVLAYRPPNARAARSLEAFPEEVWLEVHPDLWLSHDGETLLLAPANPILATNLSRGA